jgi:hypothetical protein
MFKDRTKTYNTTSTILAQLAGLAVVLPVAPFLCRFLPPFFIGKWNVDIFVAIIASVLVVQLLIRLLKPIIFPAFGVIALLLLVNFFYGKYSFRNVLNDYKSVVRYNWTAREQKSTDMASLNPSIFDTETSSTEKKILAKIDPQDSTVRNFSIRHSLDYFDEYKNKYGMLARHLSLFKYINNHFNYVPDNLRDEYFATAKETILNGLGGDCDDHSILMASCLMSIGARVRLIIVKGHMYPELYAGNKEQYEVVQQAVIQLFQSEDPDRLYYHENNGEYWINLDYTERYPGGRYMNNQVFNIITP